MDRQDGWWCLVEGPLHPSRRPGLERVLREAGIGFRVEAEGVWIQANPTTNLARSLMDDFLGSYERVQGQAQEIGRRVEPYKAMEPEVVLAALTSFVSRHAVEVLGDLLHTLVWAQGLPNSNHRSTLALVDRVLHPRSAPYRDDATLQQTQDRFNRFIRESKPLIEDGYHAPDAARARERHRRLSQDLAATLLDTVLRAEGDRAAQGRGS